MDAVLNVLDPYKAIASPHHQKSRLPDLWLNGGLRYLASGFPRRWSKLANVNTPQATLHTYQFIEYTYVRLISLSGYLAYLTFEQGYAWIISLMRLRHRSSWSEYERHPSQIGLELVSRSTQQSLYCCTLTGHFASAIWYSNGTDAVKWRFSNQSWKRMGWIRESLLFLGCR